MWWCHYAVPTAAAGSSLNRIFLPARIPHLWNVSSRRLFLWVSFVPRIISTDFVLATRGTVTTRTPRILLLVGCDISSVIIHLDYSTQCNVVVSMANTTYCSLPGKPKADITQSAVYKMIHGVDDPPKPRHRIPPPGSCFIIFVNQETNRGSPSKSAICACWHLCEYCQPKRLYYVVLPVCYNWTLTA